MDAGKAEGWLEKLEGGLTLKEGWPKYLVRLVEGALRVRFASTDHDNIEREAKRFGRWGLRRADTSPSRRRRAVGGATSRS